MSVTATDLFRRTQEAFDGRPCAFSIFDQNAIAGGLRERAVYRHHWRMAQSFGDCVAVWAGRRNDDDPLDVPAPQQSDLAILECGVLIRSDESIAGVFPALLASRLNPIEALRYE